MTGRGGRCAGSRSIGYRRRAQVSDIPERFVSRAGLKLAHALDAFTPGDPGADPRGRRCADFGCNVGGFTDCLLQRGAASVIAIDTGYGTIAWTLRNDPRVTVRERTNALHAAPPPEGVDLVVVDLAWTPQRLSIPAALRWLEPRSAADGPGSTTASARGGRIISLVKPHYELGAEEKGLLQDGFLAHDEARRVVHRVTEEMPALGARVLAITESPITGGKSSRRRGGEGNLEFLLLLAAK